MIKLLLITGKLSCQCYRITICWKVMGYNGGNWVTKNGCDCFNGTIRKQTMRQLAAKACPGKKPKLNWIFIKKNPQLCCFSRFHVGWNSVWRGLLSELYGSPPWASVHLISLGHCFYVSFLWFGMVLAAGRFLPCSKSWTSLVLQCLCILTGDTSGYPFSMQPTSWMTPTRSPIITLGHAETPQPLCCEQGICSKFEHQKVSHS